MAAVAGTPAGTRSRKLTQAQEVRQDSEHSQPAPVVFFLQNLPSDTNWELGVQILELWGQFSFTVSKLTSELHSCLFSVDDKMKEGMIAFEEGVQSRHAFCSWFSVLKR